MARADMRTVGFESVQPVQPLSLSLIAGILLILFSLTGCSDAPNLGPFLTVDDVDQYFVATEDSVCLVNDADSACLTFMPEDGPDADGIYGPIIYSHPTRLIYVFYREGVPALRPARATGGAVGGGGGGGGGTLGTVDGGGGDFIGFDNTGVNTEDDDDNNGGGGTVFLDNNPNNNPNNDPNNNNPNNNNPNNNNPNNNDPNNNDPNNNNPNNNDPNNNDPNNNGGNNNNGGESDDCEGGWVVWTQLVGDSKQSGVICRKYVVINADQTITFTGADGVVDYDENESTKPYVEVEDEEYTWEEARDRAPEILREWAEEDDN